MKKFLTLLLVFGFVLSFSFAQDRNVGAGIDVKYSTVNHSKVDYDTTFFYGNSARLYTYSGGNGFIFGVNKYGDLGKYQRIDNNFTGSVTAMGIYFAFLKTVGAVDSFDVVVRAVGTAGAPGALLFSKREASSNLDTVNYFNGYNVTGVNVTGPFFVGFEWASTFNDTIAAICDAPGEGNLQKRAWEKWSNGTYGAISDNFTNGFDADMWAEATVHVVTVPVELSSFSVNTSKDNVVLTWSTATELNNSGFVVERKSANGKYLSIAKVSGNGTTTEVKNYSYTDKNLNGGKYTYRLRQEDFNGAYTYSKEVEVNVTGVSSYALGQNYPNPFNPSTVINFSLPSNAFVTLKVYNVIGQEVMTLINANMTVGVQSVNMNAANLETGVYMYTISAKGVDGSSFTSTKKMMLIK
ncbi:MAG TPA: T9SS type A sorting domain-containing protein [Ignavibacteriaceae bacterium]|nr:T9SS type A sorting domain-containing protein [Ignavibacteriaceae bacterium]